MCGRRPLASLIVVAILTTGCGGSDDDNDAAGPAAAPADSTTSATTSAQEAYTAITTAPAGTPPGGIDRCALLSMDEVAAALGLEMSPGESAGPLGTACQWNAASVDSAYVQVQVIDDTSYWSAPSLGEGYQELAGIGSAAYVIPEMGGWSAGALTDKHVTVISINGGSSTADIAAGLLRTVVGRL